MRLVGKQVGQGVVASTADRPGKLFFIADSLSVRKFLVDTGSSYSIIPHSSPLGILQVTSQTRRAAFHLAVSQGKSKISNYWDRFFKTF
jgi:hypothetical protein